jgi:hypothetical protein
MKAAFMLFQLNAGSGSADTTWMPHPRRWKNMDVASTPYGMVRAVLE